jgi:hypothetical protein
MKTTFSRVNMVLAGIGIWVLIVQKMCLRNYSINLFIFKQ